MECSSFGRVLDCRRKILQLISQHCIKPEGVTPASNLGAPNPEKVERGEQKFRVSLGYIVSLRLAWTTWDLVKKGRKGRMEERKQG